MADDWNRRSDLKSWAISRTSRWKGSFRIKSSVDFWYRRISRRATVPGLYLWGFLTPPVLGALFRAAFCVVVSTLLSLRGVLSQNSRMQVAFVWNSLADDQRRGIRCTHGALPPVLFLAVLQVC